jgi:hypothetical protein
MRHMPVNVHYTFMSVIYKKGERERPYHRIPMIRI